MTNSEKTKTTSNLSQHKYLMIKRQLQRETERKLWATRNSGITMNSTDATNYAGQFPGVHSYREMTNREGEWHTPYNVTNHQQKSYPLSGQSLRAGTTFTTTAAVAAGSESDRKQSDLRKLLTSIQLTPQVPPNPQYSTLSNNLQYSQNSSTSLSCDEDSLSELVDIIAPDASSGSTKECSLQCVQMTLNESCDSDRPFTGRKSHGHTHNAVDAGKTPWYNHYYLRDSMNGMHAKRNRTKSAPSGRRTVILQNQRKTERRLETDFSPLNITYLSSDMQRPSSSRDSKRPLTQHGGVDTRGVRTEQKTGEVYNKKPSLFYSDPVPRSRWYEMRTAEFHIEAKRNNDFVRKVCNW